MKMKVTYKQMVRITEIVSKLREEKVNLYSYIEELEHEDKEEQIESRQEEINELLDIHCELDHILQRLNQAI